jgi:hypothetical protein
MRSLPSTTALQRRVTLVPVLNRRHFRDELFDGILRHMRQERPNSRADARPQLREYLFARESRRGGFAPSSIFPLSVPVRPLRHRLLMWCSVVFW